MRQDLITVVPYDASWPVSFERQRAVLEPILAGVLVGPIEHMGSTAVPGLAAKLIIDLLARVCDHTSVPPLGDQLVAVGWVAAPEPGTRWDDDRRGATPASSTGPITCTSSNATRPAGPAGWRFVIICGVTPSERQSTPSSSSRCPRPIRSTGCGTARRKPR